jgi:hypothetical protein
MSCSLATEMGHVQLCSLTGIAMVLAYWRRWYEHMSCSLTMEIFVAAKDIESRSALRATPIGKSQKKMNS